MNKKINILVIGSLSLALLGFSATAFAATPIVNLIPVSTTYQPLTTIPGVFQANTPTNPVTVLKGIYGLAIGVGSVIAIIMILISGLKYLYEESITGKSDARERIQNAFIGLFVILGSYLILNTINPDLVKFDFTLQSGRGVVGGLVVEQQALDKLQSALNQAAKDQTARLQAIQDLKTAIGNDNTQVAALQKQINDLKAQPASATNTNAIKGLQGQIASYLNDAAAKQSAVDTDQINNFSLSTSDLVTKDVPKQFQTQVANLTQLVTNKDLTNASLGARSGLQSISRGEAGTISDITDRIQKAQAMNLTGDAAKARDAYVLGAQQDVAYLTASKNLVDSAYGSIDTVGTVGVEKQSYLFDVMLNTYNDQATQLYASGRADLATQLRQDITSTTKLMKIRQVQNCAQLDVSTRSQLTLCQP